MQIVSLCHPPCRSREGAWIEICPLTFTAWNSEGRSREGAWIEILSLTCKALYMIRSLPWGSVDWNTVLTSVSVIDTGRSREGAWIEIINNINQDYTISGRSREGAWIEIDWVIVKVNCFIVAPVRERGLKFLVGILRIYMMGSLPWGSVDWNCINRRDQCINRMSLPWGSVDWNFKNKIVFSCVYVAPVRERGLKLKIY